MGSGQSRELGVQDEPRVGPGLREEAGVSEQVRSGDGAGGGQVGTHPGDGGLGLGGGPRTTHSHRGGGVPGARLRNLRVGPNPSSGIRRPTPRPAPARVRGGGRAGAGPKRARVRKGRGAQPDPQAQRSPGRASSVPNETCRGRLAEDPQRPRPRPRRKCRKSTVTMAANSRLARSPRLGAGRVSVGEGSVSGCWPPLVQSVGNRARESRESSRPLPGSMQNL